jgi:Na+/melibiose symporter-like transporter
MNPIAEVIGLVRTEFARRIRGWRRSLVAGAVAALFLGLALVFALIGMFLHLAQSVGAPGAALIMAAGLGLIGVIALVIASIRTRRRDLGADIQAVAAVQMEQMKQLAPGRVRSSTLLKGLGIAFAIGLISGWRR